MRKRCTGLMLLLLLSSDLLYSESSTDPYEKARKGLRENSKRQIHQTHSQAEDAKGSPQAALAGDEG